MGSKRLDLYQECNTTQAPVDMFTEQCCSRCVNPDCVRSQYGKSSFDVRTQTWEERLFTQVAKLDQADPRFEKIVNQKFIAYQEPIIVAANADWTKAKPVAELIKEAPAVILQPPPEPVQEPSAPDNPETIEPVQEAPIQEKRNLPRLPPEAVQFNTPAPQGGVMLPTAPMPTPKSDWTVPEKTEGVRIVKPGAKIKFED